MNRPSNEAIAEVYRKNLCNLSTTATALDIDRRTLYNWREADPELQKMLDQCFESLCDRAETEIYKKLLAGDPTMLIFFAKTRMRNRGYIEKQDVNYSLNKFDVDLGEELK